VGQHVKAALLAAATVREDSVTIGDEKIFVREVGVVEFAAYGQDQKQDRARATAVLMSQCVLDGPGGQLALTLEDAMQLAKSARVSLPIVAKILEVSGFSEKEPDAS
jgi:hypothetical protein